MGSVSGSPREITLGAIARNSEPSIRFELVLVVLLQGRVLLILDEIAVAGRQYSISEPMKQRKASSGVHTIGPLRTLKLVLTRTGHPVSP